MHRFSVASISPFLLSFASIAVACGGANVDSSVFDEPSDGGTGTQTDTSMSSGDSSASDSGGAADSNMVTEGGSDTSKPDTAPPPPAVTLDNVCDTFPAAVCSTSLGGCCSSKGVTWDQAACTDAEKTRCDDLVTAIKGGDGTFDAGSYSACLAAWSSLSSKCSIPILDYVKTYAPCQQLFNGSVDPGGDCTQDTDCKAASGTYVHCSGGKCAQFRIAEKDQPCTTGGTYDISLCDYGLACTSTGGGSTCKTAKPLDAMCNASSECGWGNYCAKSSFGMSGTCKAGQPQGAYCSGTGGNAVCASENCGSDGRCTDPNAELATAALCSGG